MEPALGGEPSDIDEARKGELAAASKSIEPALRTKSPLLNKPACELEAGAGIEPASRFRKGIYLVIEGQKTSQNVIDVRGCSDLMF